MGSSYNLFGNEEGKLSVKHNYTQRSPEIND